MKWKIRVRERVKKAKDDVEYRAKMYESLLQHLSAGYSLDSWSGLPQAVIVQFMQDYPEEWSKDDIDSAITDGKDCWERLGTEQANGNCMGNSRTWYYNMSNRYGWRDKVDVKSESSGQVQVNVVNYARKSRDPEGAVDTNAT